MPRKADKKSEDPKPRFTSPGSGEFYDHFRPSENNYMTPDTGNKDKFSLKHSEGWKLLTNAKQVNKESTQDKITKGLKSGFKGRKKK